MNSRRSFGLAYKAWMHKHSISQQMPHDWALATGSEGPWNSQMSLLTTDNDEKRLDPKSQFWTGLGAFNAAIESGKIPGDLKRRTFDALKDAMPFVTADDRIATSTDFFSMFIGEQEINAQYVAVRVYTADDIPGITQMCRDAFRRIAEDQMISPKEAWDKLKPLCEGMNATQIDKFRSVLSGWDEWSIEEITALTPVGDALGLPAQALDRLGKGLMSPTMETLNQMLHSATLK